MAASEVPFPPLTFLRRGHEYPAKANRIGLAFVGDRASCWDNWEVAISSWNSDAEPGRDRRREAVARRMDLIFPPGDAAAGNSETMWLYDGRQRLYTMCGTWDGSLTEDVKNVDWKDNLCFKAQRAGGIINLSRLGDSLEGECLEEQRFVQIFMRQDAAKKPGRVVVGRRIYIEDKDQIPRNLWDFPHGLLVQGRTLWLGYLAKLEEASWGNDKRSLQLTVNATAGFGVTAQNLQDFIGSFLGQWDWGESWQQRQRLDVLNQPKFGIKNLKVRTPYLKWGNRERSIKGISDKSSRELGFWFGDAWTTVEDYFKSKYGIKLKHWWLPCADLGKGTPGSRQDWVPIELVEVLGGDRNFCKTVSTEMLGATVSKLAVTPDVRLRWIESLLWEVQELQNIGAQTNWNLVELSCRELDQQSLAHGDKWAIKFQDGFFQARDVKMLSPPQKDVIWGILNFLPDMGTGDIRHFETSFLQATSSRNATSFYSEAYKRNVEIHECADRDSMERMLGRIKREWKDVALILALMPEKSEKQSLSDLYILFKSTANSLGIHSAVITPLKAKPPGKGKSKGKSRSKGGGHAPGDAMQELVDKKLDNYVNKVLQKLDILAGLKYTHELLCEGTLLLGADVRHEEGSASIAGMVAAFAWPFTQFFATCRAQMPKQAAEGERQRQSKEHIEDVEGMVGDLLRIYRDKMWREPRRVIMIRDGVSEGQFEKHREEIDSLIRALPMVNGAKPGVSWIVVQKRHQTRLFPDKEKRAQTLKNGNVKPGIVADVGIAHPKYENWFAVSHKAIQGTAVPAHYFLLRNTTSYGKDDFATLTHQLCHMYPKASCAVSYPAPAYYADHLCEYAHALKKVASRAQEPELDWINKTLFGGHFLYQSPLQGHNFFC